MKKAKSIRIDNYGSNIEVYADFGEGNEEEGGRCYFHYTDGDTIPSASFLPTIREIWEDAGVITLAQAREIKEAMRDNSERYFKKR